MRIDVAERAARRLCAIAAVAAAASAVPGMIRVVRERGLRSGRPEAVFTPVRLILLALGWLGASAAAWRPLELGLRDRARWTLLLGGLGLYLPGMVLAVAGRLALGSNYRPTSTVGATLAPAHQLVTSGPYAVVRHPMYVGLVMAAVGALALYRTWTTLLFVLQLPVLLLRASREEALLAEAFGDGWRHYAARVPAWLPPIARAW